MKQLIINADDYGWDKDASGGIIDLVKKGLIKSTSIMANHVRINELKTLEAYPEVSTGIHINLSEGPALSINASSNKLADKLGNFYDSKTLWKSYLKGEIKAEAIKQEVQAQITRLKGFDVQISHADSHQHIHQFPLMGRHILEVLKDNGIFKIRNAKPVLQKSRRMKILYGFTFSTGHRLKTFKTSQGLLAYFSTHDNYLIREFEWELKQAFKKHNKLELMIHPAHENSDQSILQRKKEYDFLSNENILSALKKNNIELINYHSL